MAIAFDPVRGDFPSFGGGSGVKRRPAVDPGIPSEPSHQGKTPPRLNPTLQTPAAAQPAPQVTRPGGSPTAPSAPTAPTAPSVPSGPPVTGAPSPAPTPGGAAGIPPHLAAAMQTPGGATTQFGGAPTPARPTPQQAPGTITPAAGQQTTPSAPPQLPGPSMSPLAAATPMQTPGAAQVFRRGQSGLLGAAGGRLEGGLGVPGVRGTQQAIPTELLALLAQLGQGGR